MKFWKVFILFILVWVLAIAARLPLSAVMPDAVIKGPANVSGTFWNGSIDNIPLRAGHYGTVSVHGSAGALFSGAIGANWTLDSLIMSGNGFASKSFFSANTMALETFTIDLSPYSLPTQQPIALFGNMVISGATIEFDTAGQCLSATGNLQTDSLQRIAGQINWQAPLLKGPLSCKNGLLVANLTGALNNTTISSEWQFAAMAVQSGHIHVTTDNSSAEYFLSQAGFNSISEGQYQWQLQ